MVDKSKLPDLKTLGGMASKLFCDIKKSVSEIITDYKKTHATVVEKTEVKKTEESPTVKTESVKTETTVMQPENKKVETEVSKKEDVVTPASPPVEKPPEEHK